MRTESGQFTVVTLAERPEMEDLFWPQKKKIWPAFMFHDLYANKNWDYTQHGHKVTFSHLVTRASCHLVKYI